jgi:hypothetical protein
MDDEQPTWNYNGDLSDSSSIASSTKPAETVSWVASEYIAHDKDATWYLWLFAGSVVLSGILYLISRDVLSAVVVLLMSSMIAVMGSRKPAALQYELSSRGLKVGNQLHNFADFRSFSVVEEGAMNSIWLKPLARFKPMVVLYCAPDDEQKIIDTLSIYLPHEQRELDAIERASRRLRF